MNRSGPHSPANTIPHLASGDFHPIHILKLQDGPPHSLPASDSEHIYWLDSSSLNQTEICLPINSTHRFSPLRLHKRSQIPFSTWYCFGCLKTTPMFFLICLFSVPNISSSFNLIKMEKNNSVLKQWIYQIAYDLNLGNKYWDLCHWYSIRCISSLSLYIIKMKIILIPKTTFQKAQIKPRIWHASF